MSERDAAGRITVTEANFVRAETDMYFRQRVKEAGIGRLLHTRDLMPIEHQAVIRANRDTLYSAGVFDLGAGSVTITLPDPGKRFMSMIVIDEDHYALQTVYAPGAFNFSKANVQTRYVLCGVRTFVDPQDAHDVASVHALQDAIRTEQAGVGSFEAPDWDPVSQKKVRDELIVRAARFADTKGMYGPRGKVDPERHLIGTATGWGANAVEDALYLTVVPPKNDGRTLHRVTVPADVPVSGFWSISVYGPDGYFHKNRQDSYSINNVTGERDAGGSVTIQFGGCDGATRNCLPITEGWNYWVRLYRPGKALVDGTYKFPKAQPLGG